MLEQCANLAVGPTILGHCGLWKTTEQGRRSDDVLACSGQATEEFIVCDDSLVHVAGHGVSTLTVSLALDLSIELHAFLLELESRFLELLVLGF